MGLAEAAAHATTRLGPLIDALAGLGTKAGGFGGAMADKHLATKFKTRQMAETVDALMVIITGRLRGQQR